jgi:LCP family protein required for cell wall assembly
MNKGLAFAVAAVAALGLAGGSVMLGATVFRQSPPVTAVVSAVEHVFVPDAAQVFGKDHLSVLLVGLDYDYDKLDQPTSKSSRSDLIMALNLDFKNHRINEVSVLRDMVATLPNGTRAKINQAQSDGGITESKAVIADWLGIPPFDRYIVMRINAAKDAIDAIGGVDVVVKNSDALKGTGPNGPLDYVDSWGHLHVHLKPGYQHLDGTRAVGYARFRHDWCSDPCRIMRQQQVVRAIVQKITHDRLNTVTHAQALLSVVRRDIETDFTTTEQLSAALAFASLKPSDIRVAQVPYSDTVILPDYGDSLIPDESAKRRLVAELLTPPVEQTDVAAAPAAGTVQIRVENGTPVAGLAARVADDLRRKGFRVAGIGNAATSDVSVTRIESDPAEAGVSLAVQRSLPGATIVPIPLPRGTGLPEVRIVLGRDLVGKKN